MLCGVLTGLYPRTNKHLSMYECIYAVSQLYEDTGKLCKSSGLSVCCVDHCLAITHPNTDRERSYLT